MAITFPSNPSPGTTHTAAGITWEWDGTSWVSLAPSGGGGGGASALGDLTDVTLTSLTTDQVIRYCLLYTSPSPRDRQKSRMPSSA